MEAGFYARSVINYRNAILINIANSNGEIAVRNSIRMNQSGRPKQNERRGCGVQLSFVVAFNGG